MNRQAAYAQRIQAVYPELVIERTTLNTTGQYSDVLIVNDALVFRFPRYAEGVVLLPGEAAVLKAIQPYLPLPVPNPIYQSLDPLTVGQAFIGYPLIPGEPLWREVVQAIDDDAVLDRLAGQLGGFLKALHTIPADEVIPVSLPRFDTYAIYQDMYARIQQKLFPLMRPDARAAVRAHFETYLNDSATFAYEPALRHGDFGTFNLLYDPVQQAICGVLDFGGVSVGDPAVDFAGLMSPVGYGEAFVRRCGQVYPEIEGMLDRVRFYVGTFALEEALFGFEYDDQTAFEAGMATYI